MSTTRIEENVSGKSCCGPTCCEGQAAPGAAGKVIAAVQEKYGAVATSRLSNDHRGVKAVAAAFGYSDEELSSIPAGANMGLSCGNPTAMASLKAGEVVVDLGCGGGLDVFLAGRKVGPQGKAIGIDMTPQMIERAKKNAAEGGYTNVEFHLAQIDAIPLADRSTDCIISNCVVNLAPDKASVFREMFRILKPGGRLAISDIALKKPLPAELAQDLMAYVGCIAGAISVEEYRTSLLGAGFDQVHIAGAGADLNAYAKVEGQSACCSPPMLEKVAPSADRACCGPTCCGGEKQASTVHEGLASVIERYDVNEYAASMKVYAVKPSL
jgi:SAM-dependent methyltransferase